MPAQDVNLIGRGDEGPTRREVLRAAGVAGLAALTLPVTGSEKQPTSLPAASQPVSQPWWMRAPHVRSRVVDIRSDSVLKGSVVDRAVLERLLDKGVRTFTGAATRAEAWRAVVGDSRRIVVKFNSVGAQVIGTTPVLARALVKALSDAGYKREHITLVEAPDYLAAELGTQKPSADWGAPIPVGTRTEQLAGYLYHADALINVPFLKTHQIAGMSGCMKNLSHALIRHPALYHDNRCSPYVGQVVGNKEVASRLKLNVVDAVRMVIRGGPDAQEADLFQHGGLLLGFDPVAVDTVGLALLGLRRQQAGLKAPASVVYLESAAELGVGRMDGHELEELLVRASG